MRPSVNPFVPSSYKPRHLDTLDTKPVKPFKGGFNETRYKTELCRQFEELGTCEYSGRCLFAHGIYELKAHPFRHPKFRTESCTAFNNDGYCSFGPRCSFVHEKVDAEKILMDLIEHVRQNCDLEEVMRRLPVFEKICPSSSETSSVSDTQTGSKTDGNNNNNS